MAPREPIAIVGLGCRFPGAASPEQFWQLLAHGVDAVREAPADRPALAQGPMMGRRGGFLERVDLFAPRRFGVSAAEAARMDPQQRLTLEVAHDALDDAAIAPESLSGTATGVYMGVASADYAQMSLRDATQVDAFTNAGAAASVVANRLSYLLDLRGPSLVLDTACSASLVAVHLACRDLWDGETDLALAGGVNVILSPAVAAGFEAAQACSPDGRCMAFDARANGMVRGEGAGVVVLKRLADARRDGDRIHAVIRGGAVNQDGRTNGLTAPNRQGQEALLRRACRQAGIDPLDVVAVEAHGTGTALGDPIEAAAIGAVYGAGRDESRRLRLGAVKTNLGHLEAAAGVAGLIKAVLALRERAWPPSLHFETPSPHIAFADWGLRVTTALEPLADEENVVGVSAFGFGGTNAHLLLAPAPPAPPEPVAPAPELLMLPLSAKVPEVLVGLAAATHALLAASPQRDLAALCRTAALRRTHHRARTAFVAAGREELLAQLAAFAQEDPAGLQRAPARPPRLVWVFPGMGSQQPGMGRELLREPAFRAAVEAVDAAMRPYQDWSLLAEMASPDLERQTRGDVAQSLVFGLQVGLARLFEAWGIRPAAVVGNSLGEIAAAHVAGALSLDQACRIVCRRAQLMMTLAGSGTMAAAEATPVEALELLVPHADRAWVAAHNAPSQLLLTGEQDALEAVILELEKRGRFGRLVRGTQVASHSPMVEPLRTALGEALGGVSPSTEQVPIFSTVVGQRVGGTTLDAAYWWRNMREPVQFAQAIAAIEAEGPSLYLELSAHPAMATAVLANLAAIGREGQALGALRRGRPERLAIRESLAALYQQGVEVAWPALVGTGGPVEPLPPAPWPRERHWIEAASFAVEPAVVAAVAPVVALETPVARVAAPGGLSRDALLALAEAERPKRLTGYLRAQVARVLGLAPAQVDTEEPLTSLGIGSLMGMELNNRLEAELGARLPVARLLAGPSIADIAQEVLSLIAQDGATPGAIPVGPRGEPAPLSLAQRRLYFLARLAPEASAYHIPGAVRLVGKLDVTALSRALDAVVARHDALRTSFKPGTSADDALQVIARARPTDLAVIDLGALPANEREEEARAIALDEARHAFDLAEGPLLRVTLLRLAPQEHWLLVTLHHLVADGWSLGVLLAELAEAYAGRAALLPPLPLQYADFARWQVSRAADPVVAADLAYWQQRLEGAPALLTLPADRPRRALQGFRGAVRGTILPERLVAAVDACARAHQATRFMVLVAAFSAWLSRASGQQDLVVGTPVAGRHHPGLEGLIGFFLNTLPLRVDLTGDPAFAELLAQARATTLEAFRHQDVPFEKVVEAVAPPGRGSGASPVFQVMIALHAPVKSRQVADLALTPVEIDGGTAKYDLTAAFLETDDGLRCAFEFDADLFDAERVEGWLAQFESLLEAAVAAPETTVSRLPIVAELPQAGTGAPLPVGDWLADLACHATSHPQDVAIEDAEGQTTYQDLVHRARAIAAALRAHGVAPGQPVAVQLPRSADMVAAWLGVLYAGAPYLPLDPQAPAARVAQILADAQPAALITDAATPFEGPKLSPAALLPAGADFTPVTGELAYLLYTSGTTGRPKGVAVSARGLANLVAWHREAYGVVRGDRQTQLANPGFDAAVWEVWPTLAAGATLCVVPQAAASPEALKAWLLDQAVTLAFVPTPLLEDLLGLPWPADAPLRAVLTGGDRLTRRPPVGLPFKLFNHYGPTEASVVATAALVTPTGDGLPSIGRPIANTLALILDAHGAPVPVGLPGELCLGGAGLAVGYWRDPSASSEKFVLNAHGERLYRTGDRARWRSDGAGGLTLEFLGRSDDQVQIRGVRVEPMEVAAALEEHPSVIDACVVARFDAAGQPQLAAYIVGDEQGASELKTFARSRLPAAFMPSTWTWLEALPRTAHGKLDRRALREPDALTPQAPGLPPRGPVEVALAAIWSELLGRPVLSRDDDFFSLGGHSLLAMRLVDRVRAQFGVEPGLQALFLEPTLAALAARIEAAGPAIAPVTLIAQPQSAHAPFPLTEIQQAYWVGRQAAGVSAHAYLELDARHLDLLALEHALAALVARHPQLRMVVDADGLQRVLADVPPFEIAAHDLRTLDDASRQATLAALRAALDHEVRDATRWPLFSVTAARLDDVHTRLYLSFDALVADAASLAILARELGQLLAGEPLPPVTASFRDYVLAYQAHVAGKAGERARAYWRTRLSTLPAAPALPLAETANTGPVRFERHAAELTAGAWSAFTDKAATRGLTPAAALLAAFAMVLARWSREPRFTLNLTLFDRRPWHPDVDRLVGDFTALELLEVDASGQPSLPALGRAIQARLAQDLDHREAAGLWCLRELARERGAQAAALPVVFTGVLDQDLGTLLPASLGEPSFGLTQTPQVDLDHQVTLRHGALAYQWDVRQGAYAAGVVEAMFAAYRGLLERLSATDTAWDTAPEVLDEPTLAQLAQYNATGSACAPDTLHGAVAAQAARTPGAVAVLAGETRLSYAELDDAARALAATLQGLAGGMVAIAIDKGAESVIAVLGTLYAGAAYVPIDPALPLARRAELLARTGATRVLTRDGEPGRWPDGTNVRPVQLNASGQRLVELRGAPDDLAYVIFTSGSTGTPKGVMLSHHAALNTVLDLNRRHRVGPGDRTFALSALGFDLSVYDLFGPLVAGGAVVLPPPGSAREPDAWLTTLAAGGVTVWNSVPALARMLLERLEAADAPGVGWPGPRLVLLSGDWVPKGLPGRLRGRWPHIEVVALGGATEAAVWSIAHDALSPGFEALPSIPYGRPLAGQSVYVLDADGRPRPPGVAGEIHLGGAGLALGYWQDAERTAAAFVRMGEGDRLYRTGDWGRWLSAPDGGLVIEFLGREDQQVKVLGLRIELGEIEAALQRLPGVEAAAVVAVGPARGEKHLVGCVVGDAEPETLEAALREALPAGMVPRAWLALAQLPLSANGKLDRTALQRLALARNTSRAALGAVGPQARVMTLLQDALGLADLRPDDDLLAFGVNSIDLVKVANRLEQDFGHRPEIADLFNLRTARDLAAFYAERPVAPPASSVLVDPAAREAFKAGRPGLRQTNASEPSMPLGGPERATLAPQFALRHSARAFANSAVPVAALADLLGCLRALDGPKYRYASAGGLYPVQTYVYVAPQGVNGLEAGAYYHDPEAHALVSVNALAVLPREVHFLINLPIADQARFTVFLVAQTKAIKPIYGDWSREFCLLEAGAMAQLLADQAPACGLGLCAVGHLDFAPVQAVFKLDAGHQFCHALLGGVSADAPGAAWSFATAAEGDDWETVSL